jgi:hypothetical protein
MLKKRLPPWQFDTFFNEEAMFRLHLSRERMLGYLEAQDWVSFNQEAKAHLELARETSLPKPGSEPVCCGTYEEELERTKRVHKLEDKDVCSIFGDMPGLLLRLKGYLS